MNRLRRQKPHREIIQPPFRFKHLGIVLGCQRVERARWRTAILRIAVLTAFGRRNFTLDGRTQPALVCFAHLQGGICGVPRTNQGGILSVRPSPGRATLEESLRMALSMLAIIDDTGLGDLMP